MVGVLEGKIRGLGFWFFVEPVQGDLSRLAIGEKSDSRLEWFLGWRGEKNKSSVCQRGVSNSSELLLALMVSQ